MALNHIISAVGFGVSVLLAASNQTSAQIKIGAVLSVTGPASFLGDPEKKTLEIYVDAINAKARSSNSSSTTMAATPTMRARSQLAWSKKTRSWRWSGAHQPARRLQ